MTGEQVRSKRRALGIEQTELAEALGINPHTVSRWERGASKILEKHWDNINNFFEQRKQSAKSRRCKVCNKGIGNMHTKAVYCSESCKNRKYDRKKHVPWQDWLEVQRLRGARQRLVTSLNNIIERRERTRVARCSECDAEFTTLLPNKLTCSDACSRRRQNRMDDKRINESNLVDRDITLLRLYKRDKGICYICNEPCDYDDKQITGEGHFVAGEAYPSIDHIIPLARGGKHAWDNVKLAHHRCNSDKTDMLPSEYLNRVEEVDAVEAYALARKVSPRKKEVRQYSKGGKLIAVYESTAEASRRTNIKAKGIQNCARGECKTYKGYVWEY